MGVTGGVLILAATGMAVDAPSKKQVELKIDNNPPNRDGKISASYSGIVKKVSGSVVNISTTKVIKQNPMTPFFNDPFFRRFFGDQFDENGGNGNRRPSRRQNSLGSGVIVSKDGYLITNNHVVNDADEIKVALADKKEFTAKVVGKDSRTDIAVLKIEANDLPFATLANSDHVEVGDVVFAIGNPFGLSQTVTMGIVSATGRGNLGIEDYEDFIQTDAAINPGNSGGALIDSEGRLIGINTAIMSGSGGNQGIGFAVPVNLARNIMDSITRSGKVERGYLGILPQDLDSNLAEEFKVQANKGALVAEVTEGSAAAVAGLKRGDVITEINGKAINDSRQLRMTVSQNAPGTVVKVKAIRDGKEKNFEVKLKAMTEETGESETGDKTSPDAILEGVGVGDLEPGMRNRLGLPQGAKGALVLEVTEDTAAFNAGLRQGDLILEINHKRVNNAEDAVQIAKQAKGKRALLLVQRRNVTIFIVVDETKKK